MHLTVHQHVLALYDCLEFLLIQMYYENTMYDGVYQTTDKQEEKG